MFQRSLYDLALGSLLGSRRVASFLLNLLQDVDSAIWNDIDGGALRESLVSALIDALDQAWPRRFRLNELERIALEVCHSDIVYAPNLPALDKVFESLMVRNGDLLSYDPRKIQAYAELASELDPTLIAGWYLAGWLSELPSPSRTPAVRVVHAQYPMFSPPPLNAKEAAENHVHLGGVTADDFVLARHLLAPTKDDSAASRSARLRLHELLQIFLRPGDVDILKTPTGAAQVLQMACRSDTELVPKLGMDWWILTGALSDDGDEIDVDWLRAQVAIAMHEGKISRAWLWLVILLWFAYRQTSTSASARAAIIYFFCEVTALRRTMIVDGQGLRRFTERYYVNQLRFDALDNKAAHSYDSVRRLFGSTSDRAEIKISPNAFQRSLPERLAIALGPDKQLMLEERAFNVPSTGTPLTEEEKAYLRSLERWQFCAHFIRGQSAPPRRGSSDNTRTKHRKNLWKEAEAFSKKLADDAGWGGYVFLNGKENNLFEFNPSHWVRGLDVAGDETAWPIEFFAPQLRWLRREAEKCGKDKAASKGYHLSVHAGEDYAHPVSGMRHVDETVRFCEMHRNDRLGHALALGISPESWMKRHGEILLPVDEHLDNLVWSYHYASKLKKRSAFARAALPELVRRIKRFLPEVAWARNISASPAQLFEAWKLRRNCPRQIGELDRAWPVSDKVKYGAPDAARLQKAQRNNLSGDVASMLFLERNKQDIDLTIADVKLVIVRCARTGSPGSTVGATGRAELLWDEESSNDLEFMLDLQDYLLTQYGNAGLWIETNPTSNIYISRLESYREHPIFRWHPPDAKELLPGGKWNKYGLRSGAMPVLINTDDPGIMPTTLRMEMALIADAAIGLGYLAEDVKRWIEDIQAAGVAQFGANHLPVFIAN